jgi:hypothetical protein
MASQGGVLATVGITPSFITQLATQTASNGVPQALGQVWQGSGQSFFGSAGQALGGALAGSAVNIALNSALGTNVVGPQGLSLTSGANILASTITPYVTGAVAAGINQSINNSLKSAGPFGPILSNIGTSLVNQTFNGITNAITGATTPGTGNATNYKMFPGADGIGEVPAVYNDGGAYTLTDIVFSLQPANQGPQAFGDSQAANDPKTATTAAVTQVAGDSGSVTSSAGATANAAKAEKMAQGTSGTTDYDRAILRFMSKGTPTSEAEIAKLNTEELTALNDTLNATDGQGLEPLPAAGYFGSWSFITAPENIEWDVANASNRVDIFGTNNPPVVAGTKGMRDLTLGNALVEGFVRGVSLEGKIAALEKLMNYKLNSSDGFVSVPVYQVWASEKSYGGSEAYYIIKDVKIKETMRDLKGNATRAYVDISLTQVPAYQVNSGRDQASATTAGAKSGLLAKVKEQAGTTATSGATSNATSSATSAANQGVGTTKPKNGAGTPTSPKTQKPPSTLPITPIPYRVGDRIP